MMKLRRIFYLAGAFLLVLIKFTIDVIGRNVPLEIGGLSVFRELTVIGNICVPVPDRRCDVSAALRDPVRGRGVLLILMVGMIVVGIVLNALPVAGFDAKNLALIPLDYPTIFVASLEGLAFGIFALLVLQSLRDLSLYQRKKGTFRNFLILIGLILAASASAVVQKPLDTSILTGVITALAVLFAVVNSFRLPWIVYLSRREKVYTLIFTFLLFGGFTVINTISLHTSSASRSLLYYSYPLKVFVDLVTTFGNIFFGLAFVSTLFHLPTAEAFDRKRSEVASLHNLSRLITQVFDFTN